MRWFDCIEDCLASGMNDFRELEVRHVWLDDSIDEAEEDVYGMLRPLFHFVLRFGGLKIIVLTGDNTSGYIPTDEDLEKLRKMMVDFLELHKEKFSGGVAPLVKARQHQDLYTGEYAFA